MNKSESSSKFGTPIAHARRLPRLAGGALAVAGLVIFSVGDARSAATDPVTIFALDAVSHVVGRPTVFNLQMFLAGEANSTIENTSVPQAVRDAVDLGKRSETIAALRPTGQPKASGSGTNLSRDGSCAVGYQDNGFFTPYHAFRWTAATGPVDLGTLDPLNNATRSSRALDVSDDCSAVVGISDFTSGFLQHAFRWTATGGMVDLGVPAGATRQSRAFGVSADGVTIVGDAEFIDSNAFTGYRNGAFRWSGGSFEALGSLSAGYASIATAVSADGTTIVGAASYSASPTTTGQSAFRWTQATGMVSLGTLPGAPHTLATAVSDNGRVIAGTTSSSVGLIYGGGGSTGFAKGSGAFRWTEATGLRDLRQLLVDAGTEMTGITLVSVSGMSPDGQWITGQATTPTTPVNETAAYIVQSTATTRSARPAPQ